MSYAQQTVNNKSFIKKFSHKKRFAVAVDLINLISSEDSFLDYGTGDGYLIILLANSSPDSSIYGYEPIDYMYKELQERIKKSHLKSIYLIKNLDTISNKKFDCVGCFEVLEHFSKHNQKKHLRNLKNLTSKDGKIIISVPIEIGLSSLLKNSVRFFVKQKHGNSSFKNIVRSFFGLPIKRNQTEYINSHIGFNHKSLERLFEIEKLKIIKKQYSPFKSMHGFLNSQVFYTLKKI